MSQKKLSRREFLRLSALGAAGVSVKRLRQESNRSSCCRSYKATGC